VEGVPGVETRVEVGGLEASLAVGGNASKSYLKREEREGVEDPLRDGVIANLDREMESELLYLDQKLLRGKRGLDPGS
jgi:hypothetical protein